MPASDQTEQSAPRFNKVLRGLDMTLFTVCAILIVDQLTAAASIGVQSIFWWLFTLVLFFIPYGLITAEMGSTYTEQGGIYAWVRRAYGPIWAGRTAWLWWVNVAFWIPSTYILFAGILAELVAPDMGLWTKVVIALVLTWITVAINIMTLEVGKWVPNIGAIFKVVLVLALGFGGIFFALRNGSANEFSVATMTPSWGASLAFLPVIIYNFLGFELMSGAAEEMENPARDVPRAIVSSGLLIAFFYVFATLGILLALPVGEIGLIEGLPNTFQKIFGGGPFGGTIAVAVFSVMVLYTLIANMTTWSLGANRSAAEAANNGDLPAAFAKLHPKYQTPANSAILCGIIGSAVLIIYGLISKNSEDLFWTTFAFSSVVFLLPYFLMFMSFLKLRREDVHIRRPYRVPGGYGTAVFLSILCMAFILQAVVFFIFKPGAVDATYVASVLGGVIITVIVGEVLVRGRRPQTPSKMPNQSAGRANV